MRIVAHVKKFYDWEPVPADVVVSKDDIAARRVKPSGTGGWLMQVTKEPEGGSHTHIDLPEEQIVAKIVHEKCRPEGGRTLTRTQAIAFYLSEHVMPQQAHKSWISKFEVHDDGPEEALLRAKLDEHVKAGNIDAGEIEQHVAAYAEPVSSTDHVSALHAHFKVKVAQ